LVLRQNQEIRAPHLLVHQGFGENISQLSLCVNVSHLDISLFHMISQEVVSHFEVFHSFVEDYVFVYRDGTGVVAHEGNVGSP
jgi:hypothetical protein